MNDIFKVMKFTMKDMIRKKSFIVATIIILLMIVIGFNIPRIIKSFKTNENTKLLIVDKDKLFNGKLYTLDKILEDYDIKVSYEDTEDMVKEKINNEEIDMGIFLENNPESIKLIYIVDNVYFFSDDPILTESIVNLYKSIQIENLDVDDITKASLTKPFSYDAIQSSEEAKGNLMLMMVLAMLLFYAVYFCAYQVSTSITVEKTSKIIETLVTSTSPTKIVIGKTLGIGLVGFIQVSLILMTAYISGKLFLDPELIAEVLDISTITVMLAFITLLYFVFGYFTYAFIYALTGSTVSKPEDIQSANAPVSIIALAGFYLAYYTIVNPNTNLASVAGILPISSPFCMPFRYMMGLASFKDVCISLLVLIVSIMIIAKVAIKIYSNAILNSGSKLNIKSIISMYKQKG